MSSPVRVTSSRCTRLCGSTSTTSSRTRKRLLDESHGGRAPVRNDLDYARELTHAGELLPGWYDDWVLSERERLNQLHVHALEVLSERLTEAHRFGDAVGAAMAAVAAEPYRESAHRAMIRAYFAEGNQAEAMRQYQKYRTLLRSETGLEPSSDIRDLITTHLQNARSRQQATPPQPADHASEVVQG